MPDHKFERKYDRQIIQLDHKQRILDLMDFQAQPPEVGIYDEPVRYFKANLEWCKFIFGLLAWAEHIAYWKDAEDELHHAIQQILIFEEGIEGGILMSPEEFKQALYEGLYKWTNDVSKQIVSGGIGGFSVDEDGNVTVGGADDGVPDDAVDDDPLTPQDEASEGRCGAVKAIRDGLNGILTDLTKWYGDDAVQDITPEVAFTRFQAKYNIDGETQIQDAISAFWALRAIPTGVITQIGTDLNAWMFCEGTTKEDISAYLIDNFAQIHQDYLVNIVQGLDDNQILTWYGRGQQVPSTDYIAYFCVPVEFEEFDLDMSTANFVSRPTTRAHKHRHRILIEASGKFIDSDNAGEERDWFWHKNASGVTAFEAPSFVNLGLFPSGAFTAVKVPYEASGIYRVTVDLVGDDDSDDGQIVIGKDNNGFNLPNTTGILHMKITDLGAY